jgi:hypothetical protein
MMRSRKEMKVPGIIAPDVTPCAIHSAHSSRRWYGHRGKLGAETQTEPVARATGSVCVVCVVR